MLMVFKHMIRLVEKIRVSRALKTAQKEIEDFISLVESLSKYDINDMRLWSAKIRKTLSLKSDCIERLYKHPLDELSFAMSINLIHSLIKRNSIKLAPEKLHGTRLLLNSAYALHYPSLRENGVELWKLVDNALDYKDHFYQSKINEGYELTYDLISLMIPPEDLTSEEVDYKGLFSLVENLSSSGT
jgi:hypothetical protein